MAVCQLVHPSPKSALFSAPETGRRICAGFSYLQRIKKSATTEVWFPDHVQEEFPDTIEWGAVRQFDLLQEADNLLIDDLDFMDMCKAHRTLMGMRAGGYRCTIITLGDYTKHHQQDDLRILDQRIQDEITAMIHFLYLHELSAAECSLLDQRLVCNLWSLEEDLSHIMLNVGAKSLFKPEKETVKEKIFFEILARLPKRNIIHDSAIGLALPDATKEKNWTFIPGEGMNFFSFQKTLTTVMQGLDETRATMTHMRGYGDHMSPARYQTQQSSFIQALR